MQKQAKPYLEVSKSEDTQDSSLEETDTNTQGNAVNVNNRPKRGTTSEALRRISEWVQQLRVPPEDVKMFPESLENIFDCKTFSYCNITALL